METGIKTEGPAYDYRQYDQVWRRVAPDLNPYPEVRAAMAAEAGTDAGLSGTAAGAAVSGAVTPAAAAAGTGAAAGTAVPGTGMSGMTPGTNMTEEPAACCLGTATPAELEMLSGFIEGELNDRRVYLCYARRAPTAYARQVMKETAVEEGTHAKRLMAVYYLMTGACYTPSVAVGTMNVPPYREALRGRYHEEMCGNFNYIRASEETTDYCLTRIFEELAADEYRHAQQMLHLLENAIRPLA